MKAYKACSREELMQLKEELGNAYVEAKGKGLKLDMSRGKPSGAQLDLTMGMLDVLNAKTPIVAEDQFDCRNYGVFDGLPEAKRLIAEMMEVKAEDVIVCGNSSLSIMYDTISRAMTHGLLGATPWGKLEKVKFLCPVPGYDRHFAVTQYFGVEMINVPMTSEGPDMDMVECLVQADDAIKGIWCIPQYSNPQGITYSEQTVNRFANLKPAAKDFRIFWDNAYVVHHLDMNHKEKVANLLLECRAVGNEDIVFEFCSSSKVSFAGSGISAIVASKANLDDMKKSLTLQTIGPDKLNQLRHVKYFKNMEGIEAKMAEHAALLKPKFDAVLAILEKELQGLEIGTWITPKGGYFISFDSLEGCAKGIVAKCKEAGVVLTGAGATFPYGMDPEDKNIRIAPSFPTPDEMAQAADLFALCVKLVSVEKYLGACE